MSTSASSSTSGSLITFSGIASGLDTSSIISKLIAVDSVPISLLQTQQSNIATQQGAYFTLETDLRTLSTAASALNLSTAYSPVTATSSDTSAATITGSTSAAAGTYSLAVTHLATAQKIATSAQTDTTSALGLAPGSFTINGVAISVASSDSLTSIASRINTANVGVTANLIDGGTGNAYLSLASTKTGLANSIQIGDLSGTPLESLGLVSSTAPVRSPITNGAEGNTFSSSSTAIGTLLNSSASGSTSFSINGVSVSFNYATDSLDTLAQSINSANTGATATVVSGTDSGGNATYKLDITGTNSTPTFSDPNNVLKSVGVLQPAIRSAITNGAESEGFSSSSSTLGTLMNTSASGSTSFSINGTSISFNFATDSLNTLASSINAANTGATAKVISSTDSSGNTIYKLDVAGTSSTPSFSDPNNVLQSLGVLQSAPANQLVGAADAKYTLDNIALTSSSNTITSAIPGATLTLAKENSTATLTLAQDTTTIAASINSFVTAYNNVVDYISSQSTFDASTYVTGALFGDPVALQTQSQLSNMLFTNVSGLSGNYNNLAALGFTLDSSTGDLTVDSTKLNTAISTNPTAVANLFKSTGSGSTPSLNFVSNTSKTLASTTAGYSVNITQAATQGSVEASVAQSGASTSDETLTFTGTNFPSNYAFTIKSGSTLSQTISQINSDSTLKNYVTASNDNGKLKLQAVRYGTAGNFAVTSSQSATTTNSGIGTYGEATSSTGVDVQGTIAGEAATGYGQYLTGNSGNTNTDGLQISYTGTSTGSIGTISFSRGMGQQISDLVTNTFVDSTSGIVTTAYNSDQTQIDDISTQITDMQAQISAQQTLLQNEFTNMEIAIAGYQKQASYLSAISGSSSSSSSVGTSSGSVS